MDHLNTFATVAALRVKPVIAEANTPLALHEFSLVSFDQSGYPQPIPPGLAELPLYPDNHGFYSVNGPLDLTGLSPRTVYDSWKDRSGIKIAPTSSDTWHTTPYRPSYLWNPDIHSFYSLNGPPDLPDLWNSTVCDPRAKQDNSQNGGQNADPGPPSSENRHIDAQRPAYYWNHDTRSCEPRAGSKRRSYLCHEPGCTWRTSFPTKQALDRHHEVKHLDKRADCPIPGCERVGDKGIKRKDNLPAHVLNKHGIKLRRQPHGN